MAQPRLGLSIFSQIPVMRGSAAAFSMSLTVSRHVMMGGSNRRVMMSFGALSGSSPVRSSTRTVFGFTAGSCSMSDWMER